MVAHGIVLPTRGVIQSSEGPDEVSSGIDETLLELATRADDSGLESVWVGDSVVARPRLEPLNTLAAVASVTDSVTLGAAVYLPALRHPLHVAHQTATVDQISGGRLALGMGVGIGPAVEHEYDQVNVQYERRGAILDEALECLDRLWRGETTFPGEFYDLSGSDIGFYPVEAPPIYVASAAFDPKQGFPTPIRARIAEHGAGWLPINMEADTFEAGITAAREFVADCGRDPADFRGLYYQDVYIAETEREALDAAREFLESYYPTWGESKSRFTDDRIKSMGAFGPPTKVEEHLQEYRDAGVEEFVTRFPSRDQHEQLERYLDIVT